MREPIIHTKLLRDLLNQESWVHALLSGHDRLTRKCQEVCGRYCSDREDPEGGSVNVLVEGMFIHLEKIDVNDIMVQVIALVVDGTIVQCIDVLDWHAILLR